MGKEKGEDSAAAMKIAAKNAKGHEEKMDMNWIIGV
jgi:hypothetical protein